MAFLRAWVYACPVRRMGRAPGRQPQQRKVHRMLVLTRKSNQSIMIGDDIEVSVLSVMGEKVRIGIQAPQEIPVFRKEIYLEIHREAAAAAALEGGSSDGGDPLANRVAERRARNK
jgi:carbon storage regulator